MSPARIEQQPEAWQDGYNAGRAKKPSVPPPGTDSLSWISGYIEGKADAGSGKAQPKQ